MTFWYKFKDVYLFFIFFKNFRQIERLTPYKCAMIYGQLPPETRSTQARLFNEENTGKKLSPSRPFLLHAVHGFALLQVTLLYFTLLYFTFNLIYFTYSCTVGYDILVASDAIGMGLNLNIKR
jgi:hypothetical protein